ncbi:MAG: pyridoxal-phosphate dependent enzyme [Candidatus Eisenbacteria bacterium]
MSNDGMQVYDNILQTVGHTPLVRLSKMSRGLPVPIYGKLEAFNPGGSAKDRIGVSMIEAALAAGQLKPGGTIVECTSGNTGVGLAMAACVMGFKTVFCMPDKVAREKITLLKAYGAEVVVCPTAVPPDSPESYYQVARRIARERPNAFLTNQYDNPANPAAHYRTTGPEIWEQTAGRITHYVTSIGTGGTISGTAKFLKEKNPNVHVVGADPVGSILCQWFHKRTMGEAHTYKVEGIGEDFLPEAYDWTVIDDVVSVGDRESLNTARRLAREEGILAGGSAGTALWAAIEEAKRAKPGDVIVVIIPDTGERYLSKVHNDEWMRDNHLLDPTETLVSDLLFGKSTGGRAVLSVAAADPLRRALELVREYDVSQLPVLDGEQVVGTVYDAEIMKRVLDDPAALDRPVREMMEPPLPVVALDMPVTRVAQLLKQKHSSAVLVAGNGGGPGGILTRLDVISLIAE